MTQTKTYRNEATGYTVTLIDYRPGVAKVVDSKGYDFAMIGIDYKHAPLLASSRAHINGAVEVAAVPEPAQIVSPLAPAAQVAPSNLATGATLTMPTLPEARCIDWAYTHDGSIRRGMASVTGATAPLSVLRAMARRGWVTLHGSGYRPTHATVKPSAAAALATYRRKHGEVL